MWWVCPEDEGWCLEAGNTWRSSFGLVVEDLEVYGKVFGFFFLESGEPFRIFVQRNGLVGLCFWTSVGHWETLIPQSTHCRSSSLRRRQPALELLWMSLIVLNVLREGPDSAGLQTVFLFEGSGKMQTSELFSFPSSAISGCWWDPGRKFWGWSGIWVPDSRIPGRLEFPVTFLKLFLRF